jgi:hypothetical protein
MRASSRREGSGGEEEEEEEGALFGSQAETSEDQIRTVMSSPPLRGIVFTGFVVFC